MEQWFWPEAGYGLSMAGIFMLCALRLPSAVALVVSALAGGLVSNFAFPIRQLLEGSLGFIQMMITVATAMIFLRALWDTGLSTSLAGKLIRKYHNFPLRLALCLTILLMLPSMLTGMPVATRKTTGRDVYLFLDALGIPEIRIKQFITAGAIWGMLAPPINLPVLMLCASLDISYTRCVAPLCIMILPLALLHSLWLIYPLLRNTLPCIPIVQQELHGVEELCSLRGLFLSIIIVGVLLTGEWTMPTVFPLLDSSMYFLLASAIFWGSGLRWHVYNSAREAVGDALPTLGALAGAGMLLQILTFTGVRGLLSVGMSTLPLWGLYGGAGFAVLTFGLVSPLAAIVFWGVPFLLIVPEVVWPITAVGVSFLAGAGFSLSGRSGVVVCHG